eukprot:m.355808 g.355808  ORF g.355808 m.355808 type:complete len:137 (-) comp17345_c0_seq1:297-707(-)
MSVGEQLNRIWDEKLSEFERTIRPQHRKEFQCCIDCADKPNLSSSEYHECLSKCRQPMMMIERSMQQEVAALMDGLSRCAQQCESIARSKITPDMTAPPPAVEQELKKCVSQCEVEHEKLLPALFARMNTFANSFK